MNIVSQHLVEALKLVISAVERRPQLPVLESALLRFGGGKLEVIGRNSEYQLRVSRAVEGHRARTGGLREAQAFALAVPARKLLDLLSKFPKEQRLEIAPEEGALVLRTGRGRYRLAASREADFPLLEPAEIEVEISVSLEAFRDLLSSVLYCMASGDVRLSLNGFLLEVVGDELRAVASDGHRLAYGALKIENPQAKEIRLVVPRRAALELYRKLRGKGEVQLWLGSDKLTVLVEGTELTTLLIDAPFPDYRLAFPKEIKLVLHVARLELLGALDRLRAVIPEESSGVRLKIDAGALVVSSYASETGDEGEERLAVEVEGDPFEVVFNPQYLREALRHLAGEKVRLQLSSPLGASLLEDGSCFRHVVMPMRIQ